MAAIDEDADEEKSMDEKKIIGEKKIIDGEEGEGGEDYALVRRPRLPGARNKGPKAYTEASGSRGYFYKAQSQFDLSFTIALSCMMYFNDNETII